MKHLLDSALALNVENSAKALGVGKTSLYAFVKAQKIKPVYLGGRTLFLVDDLKRLLMEHRAA